MHGIPQKVGILEFAMLSAGVHSRRAFSKVGGIAFGQSSRGGVRIPWSIRPEHTPAPEGRRGQDERALGRWHGMQRIPSLHVILFISL